MGAIITPPAKYPSLIIPPSGDLTGYQDSYNVITAINNLYTQFGGGTIIIPNLGIAFNSLYEFILFLNVSNITIKIAAGVTINNTLTFSVGGCSYSNASAVVSSINNSGIIASHPLDPSNGSQQYANNYVYGNNIPFGTVVSSINPGANTITLSKTPTGSGSTLVFGKGNNMIRWKNATNCWIELEGEAFFNWGMPYDSFPYSYVQVSGQNITSDLAAQDFTRNVCRSEGGITSCGIRGGIFVAMNPLYHGYIAGQNASKIHIEKFRSYKPGFRDIHFNDQPNAPEASQDIIYIDKVITEFGGQIARFCDNADFRDTGVFVPFDNGHRVKIGSITATNMYGPAYMVTGNASGGSASDSVLVDTIQAKNCRGMVFLANNINGPMFGKSSHFGNFFTVANCTTANIAVSGSQAINVTSVSAGGFLANAIAGIITCPNGTDMTKFDVGMSVFLGVASANSDFRVQKRIWFVDTVNLQIWVTDVAGAYTGRPWVAANDNTTVTLLCWTAFDFDFNAATSTTTTIDGFHFDSHYAYQTYGPFAGNDLGSGHKVGITSMSFNEVRYRECYRGFYPASVTTCIGKLVDGKNTGTHDPNNADSATYNFWSQDSEDVHITKINCISKPSGWTQNSTQVVFDTRANNCSSENVTAGNSNNNFQIVTYGTNIRIGKPRDDSGNITSLHRQSASSNVQNDEHITNEVAALTADVTIASSGSPALGNVSGLSITIDGYQSKVYEVFLDLSANIGTTGVQVSITGPSGATGKIVSVMEPDDVLTTTAYPQRTTTLGTALSYTTTMLSGSSNGVVMIRGIVDNHSNGTAGAIQVQVSQTAVSSGQNLVVGKGSYIKSVQSA